MERTAWKGDVAMIRFGSMDRRIMGWRIVGKNVGFTSGLIRRLEKSGRKMGAAPNEWRAMKGGLALEHVATIEVKVASGWEVLDRDALQVERLAGDSVQLIGSTGLAAIVGRKRTCEGYYAYATNCDSHQPENLLSAVNGMRRVG